MNENVIRELNFLRDPSIKMIVKTADVEHVINILFIHSDLFTFPEAMAILSTLYMLDLITKRLYDELVKAL